MHSFFKKFNRNIATACYPSSYLAVDETLYSYCRKTGFKQFNASKPARYGLLYCSPCDAVVSNTYYSLPFAGKPEILDNENTASKFYVSGRDKYTKYQVKGFSVVSQIDNGLISVDRYFTSIPLVRWAAEKTSPLLELCNWIKRVFHHK